LSRRLRIPVGSPFDKSFDLTQDSEPVELLRVLFHNVTVWTVYILLCDNIFYYIGLTSNIDNRLISHKSKHNLATKEYLKVKLLYKEVCFTRNEAEKREKQLKGWTRAKKKALIDGNIELLKQLSKS
jgi:putative endonuclease